MEEEEEKTLCGICGLLELEHRNDERHSFISYADMEKARMDYYDRKTAHREEMLRPLAWLALVTFFLMVFGSIAGMLGFPI